MLFGLSESHEKRVCFIDAGTYLKVCPLFLRAEFTDLAPSTAKHFGIILWRKLLPIIHLSKSEMLCLYFFP